MAGLLKEEDKKEESYTMTTLVVFQHYLKNEDVMKRKSTIKRQKSQWNNHVDPAFGNTVMN